MITVHLNQHSRPMSTYDAYIHAYWQIFIDARSSILRPITYHWKITGLLLYLLQTCTITPESEPRGLMSEPDVLIRFLPGVPPCQTLK